MVVTRKGKSRQQAKVGRSRVTIPLKRCNLSLLKTKEDMECDQPSLSTSSTPEVNTDQVIPVAKVIAEKTPDQADSGSDIRLDDNVITCAGESVSTGSESHRCILCNTQVPEQGIPPDPLQPNSDVDTEDLIVMFVLRNILNIPGEKLAQFLPDLGQPGKWISSCEPCRSLILKAFKAYKVIKSLESSLTKYKAYCKAKITLTWTKFESGDIVSTKSRCFVATQKWPGDPVDMEATEISPPGPSSSPRIPVAMEAAEISSPGLLSPPVLVDMKAAEISVPVDIDAAEIPPPEPSSTPVLVGMKAAAISTPELSSVPVDMEASETPPPDLSSTPVLVGKKAAAISPPDPSSPPVPVDMESVEIAPPDLSSPAIAVDIEAAEISPLDPASPPVPVDIPLKSPPASGPSHNFNDQPVSARKRRNVISTYAVPKSSQASSSTSQNQELEPQTVHVCNLCEWKTKVLMQLQEHKLVMHDILPERSAALKKCPQEGCQFRTVVQKKYDMHLIKEHGATRSAECKVCRKPFLQLPKPTGQESSSSEKKLSKCDSCSKSFPIQIYMLQKKMLLERKRPTKKMKKSAKSKKRGSPQQGKK